MTTTTIRSCRQYRSGRLASLLRILTGLSLFVLHGALVAETGSFRLTSQQLADIASEYGKYAVLRIHSWEQLINTGRQLSEQDRLERTNDFFNSLGFKNDVDHWGKQDYWATPLETLASNGGDCEDFSIGKYFTLLQMGVPAERLRLTYVKALELNQAHMVLSYAASPDSEPLILDNLNSKILPASSRQDLLPVYSFNGHGLWLTTSRGMEQEIGKPERLSHWNSMIARISDEQLTVTR